MSAALGIVESSSIIHQGTGIRATTDERGKSAELPENKIAPGNVPRGKKEF
jgi:hypothetical protein